MGTFAREFFFLRFGAKLFSASVYSVSPAHGDPVSFEYNVGLFAQNASDKPDKETRAKNPDVDKEDDFAGYAARNIAREIGSFDSPAFSHLLRPGSP